MSYRSIKRVLGETSLERKCRFLFGACLLLLITASFWWYGQQTADIVYRQNQITGRLLADQEMLVKHWKKLAELEQREETDAAAQWAQGQSTPQFIDIINNLTQKLAKKESTVDFIRVQTLDGEGKPTDEFEWEVLDRFLKSPPPDEDDEQEFAERLDQEKNEYEYYQPIRAEASCLEVCHRAVPGTGIDTGLGGSGFALGKVTAEAPGDLLSIVKVTIPYGPTQKQLDVNKAILLATAIITVFLAMIASYVIVRYVIVKPLRHLRDVSDAVSRGNISLRAEIQTGDEFEALAVAFNRMLRHLVTIQEELRQVNADLDNKVDQLAQVNMRLYELNTIKSDFLATMSHELRTPLNSILGFSDVLSSIESLDEKQKRYVTNIRNSGRVLLDMINDILDLAKIESGKMDTRLTDFRVEQVIHAQCDMARPLTERKNIDLEVELPDDLPVMHQDQARVQQILGNLLSNAIKFTPEGGRITVSARHTDDEHLVMDVADTGVGIAEEDQQAIFEKFRQGRTAVPDGDTMTREYSGTGLGLSIVRELCRLLGGEISVQSELGRGSTFRVRLPWRLEEQPRLDSTLAEEFEEFTRTRIELHPDDAAAEPAQQAAE